MKLISLNIWGGNAYDALMAFIREQAKDTDIFCFQEVFRSLNGLRTHLKTPSSRVARDILVSARREEETVAKVTVTTVNEAEQEQIRNPSGYGQSFASRCRRVLGVARATPSDLLLALRKIGRYRGRRGFEMGSREIHGTRTNGLADLSSALKDFECYFCPVQNRFDLKERVDFDIEYGQAIFLRKALKANRVGEVFVYRNRNEADKDETIPAAFNYVEIENEGKRFVISNFHGLAFPGDKLDTPERLEQSEKILKFLQGVNIPKILCGDFNLMPETESIAIIERAGMQNLIKEFKIATTRSELNYRRYPDNPQYFADYTFVSPEVRVTNFEVPQISVSDHLPMILEFTISTPILPK